MNGLTYATVAKIRLINPQTILFRIDLSSHANLANPVVVQAAMEDYAAKFPNITAWEAVANDGWLNIYVTGKINRDTLVPQ